MHNGRKNEGRRINKIEVVSLASRVASRETAQRGESAEKLQALRHVPRHGMSGVIRHVARILFSEEEKFLRGPEGQDASRVPRCSGLIS